MSQKEEIKFYSVGGSYGEFSCFAVYPIRVKGKVWPTTEHYYQAQKFAGTSQELAIQKAATPMKAAELGRTKKIRVRPTWDNVKDNIMMEAMRAKFTQYADLKAMCWQPRMPKSPFTPRPMPIGAMVVTEKA